MRQAWGSACRLAGLAAMVLQLGLPLPAAAQQTAVVDDKERVEADISTRNVSLGTDFTGSQVVIFGTVENSKQLSAEQRLYDIAVVIEGPGESLTAWRKTNILGLWLNTASLSFKDVPSYYAVLSTRPIEEVAPKPVLYQLGIGFENLRMEASETRRSKELGEFKQAVIRLKKAKNLYQEEPQAVSFIGRSLFRSTLSLPATVTVGEFTAWVYLFRGGELLSTFKARLNLERSGVEQTIHTIATRQPLFYGFAAVGVAVLAGFLASALFRKP